MTARGGSLLLPGDSYWVIEGRLLAGPYPGAPTREEARRKLGAFLDLGVRHFIDLTEEGEGPPLHPYAAELRELAGHRGLEVDHIRFPVPDLTAPTEMQTREILSLIHASLEVGEIPYVHCWGGVGRTGAIVGCFLVEQGCPPGDAIARIAELRRSTERADRSSPERPAQNELIEGWSPR